MGQVTARISEDLETALNRWAADDGVQRSELIRQILTEATDARQEGRAMFDAPAAPTPVDLQHLIAGVSNLLVELDRVLRQNAKRDAALVQNAKTDGIGVSAARIAIIAQLTDEMRRLCHTVLAALAKLPTAQIAALAASPMMIETAATLKRIEQHPSFMDMQNLQEAHTIAVQTLNATINRQIEQPRTVNNYTVWDQDWSRRKVLVGLATVWLVCVASYHCAARMLPVSWLAVRSAQIQMGQEPGAICAFLEYRYATADCTARFHADPIGMTVEVRQ